MALLYKTKCPYCDFEQSIGITPSVVRGSELVLCDIDEGGCDSHYAVFWRIAATIESCPIGGQGKIKA